MDKPARVTANHQISIPKDIRDQIGLKAGQEFSVVKVGGVIHLVPYRTLESLRGILRDVDTSDYREKTDEERL
jgi:AbrB family looped-hinge helix DNA binding protein